MTFFETSAKTNHNCFHVFEQTVISTCKHTKPILIQSINHRENKSQGNFEIEFGKTEIHTF